MVRPSKIGKILKNNRREKKQSNKNRDSANISPLLHSRSMLGDSKILTPKVIIEKAEDERGDFENRAKRSLNYSDFRPSFDRFDDIRRNRSLKCGYFPDSSLESSDVETSGQTSESETKLVELNKKDANRVSTIRLLTPTSHEIRRSITIDHSENLLSPAIRSIRPSFRRTTTTPLLMTGVDQLMFEHLKQHHRRMTATSQQFSRDYLIRRLDDTEDEENNNNNVTSADVSDLPDFEDFLSDEEDEHRRHDSLLKKFVHKVLPHLGLFLLTCAFTMAGAAAFFGVEEPHAQKTKNTSVDYVARNRTTFLAKLWSMINENRSNVMRRSRKEFDEEMDTYLDAFAQSLFQAFSESRLNYEELKANKTIDYWSFPRAVFFAFTCLSTIVKTLFISSYGNPVPVTTTGRTICIFFSLFGVPLTLITIADIGKFFSEYLVWLYGQYLTLSLKFGKHFRPYRALLIRKWNSLRSFRKKPTSGNGHYVEKMKTLSGDEEISKLNGNLKHNQGGYKKKMSVASKMVDLAPTEQPNERQSLAEHIESVLGVSYQEKNVPALLLLFILIGYTAMGGLLLQCLEEWQFFDAFYFSFVTLVTIGFGDLVPTKGDYMTIIILYIFVGLIITTMCIDLVGGHYLRKIHYFGRKMQNARTALAIVGGKVVYLSDLYAHFLSKRYGIPRRQQGYLPDSFLLEHLYASRHLIPFVPRDIRVIRYIDENSDSWMTDSTASLFDYHSISCRYCHNRSGHSFSRYSKTMSTNIA